MVYINLKKVSEVPHKIRTKEFLQNLGNGSSLPEIEAQEDEIPFRSKRLRRPCKKCGQYYIPSGKFCKYCNNCNPQTRNKKYPMWLTDESKRHLENIRAYKWNAYKNPNKAP